VRTREMGGTGRRGRLVRMLVLVGFSGTDWDILICVACFSRLVIFEWCNSQKTRRREKRVTQVRAVPVFPLPPSFPRQDGSRAILVGRGVRGAPRFRRKCRGRNKIIINLGG
jgi:hypothetical protein